MNNRNNRKRKYISIEKIKDVYEFVNKAIAAGDVEVMRDNFCVDGKSLMGLISIDPSTRFIVIYPKDAEDFEFYISQFEC